MYEVIFQYDLHKSTLFAETDEAGMDVAGYLQPTGPRSRSKRSSTSPPTSQTTQTLGLGKTWNNTNGPLADLC